LRHRAAGVVSGTKAGESTDLALIQFMLSVPEIPEECLKTENR
jgi:hypothetical protein